MVQRLHTYWSTLFKEVSKMSAWIGAVAVILQRQERERREREEREAREAERNAPPPGHHVERHFDEDGDLRDYYVPDDDFL
jgi:hypothetical protein